MYAKQMNVQMEPEMLQSTAHFIVLSVLFNLKPACDRTEAYRGAAVCFFTHIRTEAAEYTLVH